MAVESEGPRYRQLAERLIEEIRRGERPVGSTLPGELELMNRFGVSRHTVREALRRLEAIGLIERRRRRGTIVRATEPTESYQHTVRSLADLLQYPPDSRLEPIDTATVDLDASTARVLGCKPGGRWARLRAVRRLHGAGAPICRVDVYLLPELATVLRDVGRQPLRVFELVEQRFGRRVANVRIDVSAHSLAREAAERLGVPAGSPSLRVVRRYYDDGGRLFEVTLSEHPADRFAFSLELQREWLRPGHPTGNERATKEPAAR